MALISLIDMKALDFADIEVLMDNLDTIKNELNGLLDNANIAAGADIDPGKIGNGGAVTAGELTSTGEAGKIPTLDSSGDMVIGRRLVFYEGAM